MGYVEGQNVRIEYRWMTDRYSPLPAMATDRAAPGGDDQRVRATSSTCCQGRNSGVGPMGMLGSEDSIST
jgi:hypothetical protein